MTAPARLRHDPEDPKHLLYCSNLDCWGKRPKFTLGRMAVDLELTASEIMMVVMPDGITRQEFKKGHVELVTCSNCGTIYLPDSAYDPA